ncbi:30S ribosomal protein S9 [Anaplasmataceae bacterium AB001_6]|nr:30S ribosomal protein S9 [Anaplasmataceae bacterium AB001_6]
MVSDKTVKVRKVGKSFLAKSGDCYGTGRRKSSVAKVWIVKGSGNFVVNGLLLDKYFVHEYDVRNVLTVFRTVNLLASGFDVKVAVSGGGTTGQSGAIVLGLSRALAIMDDDHRVVLRNSGFLTRDSRVVESKKYGRKKARKRFQFSKR